MRRAIQITVSLGCLGAIFFSARYAVGRERVRKTDLLGLYQQINLDSFGGALPDVAIEWGNLKDTYGETQFSDSPTVIEIDRASVTSEEQLEKKMQHEACHVYTRLVVEETGQDAHGEAFQSCMKRFE
jgi:predicted SprT family Zn-dependent metalloprotease